MTHEISKKFNELLPNYLEAYFHEDYVGTLDSDEADPVLSLYLIPGDEGTVQGVLDLIEKNCSDLDDALISDKLSAGGIDSNLVIPGTVFAGNPGSYAYSTIEEQTDTFPQGIEQYLLQQADTH